MAGEIQVIDNIGMSVYVLVFDLFNRVWNKSTNEFEAVSSASWIHYAIPVVDTTGTGIYVGDFPSGIDELGDYPVVAYEAQTPGTPSVGDLPTGAKEVMHWDGVAEVPVAGMGPQDVIAELYGSFVVNTTTFQKVMQGLAAVNLGDLVEDTDHSISEFTDVNDPATSRVKSANTGTTRSVTLN